MADTPQNPSQSTNGTVPVDQQPDTTIGTSVDEKITTVDRRVETPLPRVDINQPVAPGHDMVVNHVDGSQELAQGHVAAAVQAKEAETGEVVSLADVEAGEAQENPRTPDPEVNGPSKQAVEQGLTTEQVIAASQPDVAANEPTPAAPTPTEGDAPATAASLGVRSTAPSLKDDAADAPAEEAPEAPAEDEPEAPTQPSADDVEGV